MNVKTTLSVLVFVAPMHVVKSGPPRMCTEPVQAPEADCTVTVPACIGMPNVIAIVEAVPTPTRRSTGAVVTTTDGG